jgi:hypothetical protein
MTTKKCIFTSTHIVGSPGSPIYYYGHPFIIQSDGRTAIADIDEKLAKSDIAAGRYRYAPVAEKPKPAEAPKPAEQPKKEDTLADLEKIEKEIKGRRR